MGKVTWEEYKLCQCPGPDWQQEKNSSEPHSMTWGAKQELELAFFKGIVSVPFSSVAQLCPTLCDPMDCSTPGLPVHRQLPEFTQTHVH